MEELRYIIFNKPYGVITAFSDAEGHNTLKEFIPVAGVYAAGRLDLDSEGLLLLSDDGPLMHALTDPNFHHEKTYLVQVEGEMNDAALGILSAGVVVKGIRTRRCQALVIPEPDLPERAKPVSPHGPTTWLRIVLTEGKKRQIRHMTAAVGFPTLRLVRVAIGPLSLGDLKPGEWRALTPAEIQMLKHSLRVKGGRNPGGSGGSVRGSRYRSGGPRSPGPGSRPSGAGGPTRK
jgi:23S rRNA pseudouridine2457 synthase